MKHKQFSYNYMHWVQLTKIIFREMCHFNNTNEV